MSDLLSIAAIAGTSTALVWGVSRLASVQVSMSGPVQPKASLADTLAALEARSGVAVDPLLATQHLATHEPHTMAPTPETEALARAYARHERRLKARKARRAAWAQRKADIRQLFKSLTGQRF